MGPLISRENVLVSLQTVMQREESQMTCAIGCVKDAILLDCWDALSDMLAADGQRMFAILAAMEHWRKKTCVTFARRRQEADYIEFREVEG